MASTIPLVADIVIAGAGICGLSAARYLARRLPPSTTIAIISQHAPASYTSSLSTECYRDHWPSTVMRSFMDRSIDLLRAHAEETNDAFRVQNKGYLYVSSQKNASKLLLDEAMQCHGPGSRGSGGSGGKRRASSSSDTRGVRIHTREQHALSNYTSHSFGADVFTDGDSARSLFPFLHSDITAALHARNAGWVSAQTMGACMMDEMSTLLVPSSSSSPTSSATSTTISSWWKPGTPRIKLIKGSLLGVSTANENKIKGVTIRPFTGSSSSNGEPEAPLHISCGTFVNATGPYLDPTHRLMFASSSTSGGANHTKSALPVFSEVHSKVVFRDVLGIIPRDAPMTICNDSITPAFEADELEFIAETNGKELADQLSAPGGLGAGAHFRPYGGAGSDAVLLLWEAWHHGIKPESPVPTESVEHLLDHEFYPEVVLRGLAAGAVPDLRAYFDDEYKGKWLESQRKKLGEGGGGGGVGVNGGNNTSSEKKPLVDGGYYTKTEENIPLIGPAPGAGGSGFVEGAYICGAVSGYGIMAGHAAGELLAMHVDAGTASVGSSSNSSNSSSSSHGALPQYPSSLPSYATIMDPLRYQREEFTKKGGTRDQLLAAGGGQL